MMKLWNPVLLSIRNSCSNVFYKNSMESNGDWDLSLVEFKTAVLQLYFFRTASPLFSCEYFVNFFRTILLTKYLLGLLLSIISSIFTGHNNVKRKLTRFSSAVWFNKSTYARICLSLFDKFYVFWRIYCVSKCCFPCSCINIVSCW